MTTNVALATILLDFLVEIWYNVCIGPREPTMTRHSSGQTPAARAKTQAKYNSKPEQIRERSNRNKARAKLIKAGKVRKGDGKDVAHANNNTYDNNMLNLLVQPPRVNRSFKRNAKGGHKL
jgi:hypothetical protein